MGETPVENVKIYHAVYYLHGNRGICKTIRGEWLVEIPDLFEERLRNYCYLYNVYQVKFSYLFDETDNLNVLAICSPTEPSFSRKRAVAILRGRRFKWINSRLDGEDVNYLKPLDEIQNKWARFICFANVKQPKRD